MIPVLLYSNTNCHMKMIQSIGNKFLALNKVNTCMHGILGTLCHFLITTALRTRLSRHQLSPKDTVLNTLAGAMRGVKDI